MRAQVAELQHESSQAGGGRQQGQEGPRVVNADVGFGPFHSGAAGSRNVSNTMQMVIDAANSTLKEVRKSRNRYARVGSKSIGGRSSSRSCGHEFGRF